MRFNLNIFVFLLYLIIGAYTFKNEKRYYQLLSGINFEIDNSHHNSYNRLNHDLYQKSYDLSIVIPCYNKIQYLNRSVTKLANYAKEHLLSYQFVVVDDGSSDGSVEYVLEQMKSINCIILAKHYYNSGTFKARYTGALASSGRYLLSLDPDDDLLIQKLPSVISHAKIHDYDMVCINGVSIFISNLSVLKEYRCRKQRYWKKNEFFSAVKERSIRKTIWDKIVKTSIFLKACEMAAQIVGEKRLIYSEDLLILPFILSFLQNGACIPKLVYIYYIGYSDNSKAGKYQPITQNKIQEKFVFYVRRIFSDQQNNGIQFNPKSYLEIPKIKQLYDQIPNIDIKQSSVSCSNYDPKIYQCTDNHKFNFCLIQRAKSNHRSN